jgi:threonine/homoserine/homoserine lactone efflux protein
VDWNSLAQFSAATLLVFITPGPIMAIIAYNTLRRGTMAGLSTVIGVELGEVCLLGVVFGGLSFSGELLPVLFPWLSLAGVLYLIWPAASALRLRNEPSRCPRDRAPVLDGLAIAFANPAALLFYAAFFPQFTDPDHPISSQMVLLSAIYVCMRALCASACVVTVACLRPSIGRAQAGRSANLVNAAVYLGIAVIGVLRFVLD